MSIRTPGPAPEPRAASAALNRTSQFSWQPIVTQLLADSGAFRARLRFEGADHGLSEVSWRGDRSVWPGPILAPSTWQVRHGKPRRIEPIEAPVEYRHRGNTADIVLNTGGELPVRFQFYWRVAGSVIEMQVLASPPILAPFDEFKFMTRSRLPSGVTLVPVRRGQRIDWRRHACAAGAESCSFLRSAASQSGARSPRTRASSNRVPLYAYPLVVHRPSDVDWSYVEMSPVDDCYEVELRQTRRWSEIGFGLFGLDFEKGVILRGRVRGVVVDRVGDTDHAVAEYVKLLAEPPPLSV